jgi:hypothetical protein
MFGVGLLSCSLFFCLKTPIDIDGFAASLKQRRLTKLMENDPTQEQLLSGNGLELSGETVS